MNILKYGRTPCRPYIAALALAFLMQGACAPSRPAISVFSAAAFEPVLHQLRPEAEAALGVRIQAETGGSGNLIRRVVELGRQCDLMLLADPGMFKKLGKGRFDWRIDFASDEMVLGIGTQAPRTDEAERDWVSVLSDPTVRLARADESISPAGARAIIVCTRREAAGALGLRARLLGPTSLVTDDVGTLAARLKAGEADYAFLYRSSCLLHELRYIRLESPDRLSEDGTQSDPDAICYSLSIPNDVSRPEEAEKLIRFFLVSQAPLWADSGFIPLKPRFFGSRDAYARFRDIADYGGPF